LGAVFFILMNYLMHYFWATRTRREGAFEPREQSERARERAVCLPARSEQSPRDHEKETAPRYAPAGA